MQGRHGWRVVSLAGKNVQSGRIPQTIVGIAFDAEELGLGQAERRAWQMWLERLDPAELHGAAFYDGPWLLPSGKRVLLIAISGPQPVVKYVHDAFAAPDLVAFAGILPATQRIISAQDLPRERLEPMAYVDERGTLVLSEVAQDLRDIALHARWSVISATPSHPIPQMQSSKAKASGSYQPSSSDTLALKAPMMEGATAMNLRIWRPSYRDRPRRSRRLLFGIIGTLLILTSAGIVAARLLLKQSLAHGITTPLPTATATYGPQPLLPVMVVAPLSLTVPCVPGRKTQFVISNNGLGELDWSSNAAFFAPRLIVSAVDGVITPGSQQIVQVTLGQVIKGQQTIDLVIQSNGGETQIVLTIGAC